MGILTLMTFRPFFAQNRVSFNDNWKFYLAGTKAGDSIFIEPDNAHQAGYDDRTWRLVDLPHDWSIEQEYSNDHSPRNAWLPGGIGWYRKDFKLKPEDKGKYIEIQFDAIYRHAEIWVNGEYVGVQYDGYTSFYFDITPFVQFEGPNTIAVRVDNSIQPNCRWYTGSGIHRNAWIRKTDPVHVQNWGTAITTPEVGTTEAKVLVRTSIENTHPVRRACTLETRIFDTGGREVSNRESDIGIDGKHSVDVDQTFTVLSPKPWSVNTPALYTAVSLVKVDGKVVDKYKSRFGIREVKFDAETGFYLNGENMKLKGVNLHSDAAVLGSAIPVEVWRHRLLKLKKTGTNAIRTAHNPMAPEFMDLCDEMGFLVMDEFVDKWDHEEFANPHFHTEWQKNFRETIRRDRNHPSVIIWSVGNENYGPEAEGYTKMIEKYCGFVRSVDPSRPVVSGMLRGRDGDPDEKVDNILRSTEHMDFIAMNYGEQWVKRIKGRNPGKAYVSTESNHYYGSTETDRWSLTERSPWFDVLENDFNMGQFLWVGIEYMGEIPPRGPDSWPEFLCWPTAFLTTAGFRTPLSYQFQALWTREPMVFACVYEKDRYKNPRWGSPAVIDSWNQKQGDTCDLVTYTNCDHVELYINDRKIGQKKLSDFSNHIMNWEEIPYEPGTLKAVGIIDGKEVCEHVIRTSGDPAMLKLKTDSVSVQPGGYILVEVHLTDKNGIPVNHSESKLVFEVENGRVAGLDNGGLTVLDPMKETKSRRTHLGKCLAIIQAGLEPGKLVLNVSGKGISKGSLSLDIINTK